MIFTKSIIIIFSLSLISLFSYKVVAKSQNVDIFRGMELYTSNCASSHMGNLAGNPDWKSGLDDDGQRLPPPLNGTGHTWHHAPEQLFQVIRYGYKKFDPNYKGKMQGNDDLSEDDVWSILEYIKSVWPKEIRDKYNNHFK